MNIQLNKLDKENTVIHCRTSNEAKQFLNYLKDKGYTWEGFEPYESLDNLNWEVYEVETGYILTPENRVSYTSILDNVNKYKDIITFKELTELPNIKGYCKDCSYKYIDGKYSMCKRLNIIITPKFYCKDFKSI